MSPYPNRLDHIFFLYLRCVLTFGGCFYYCTHACTVFFFNISILSCHCCSFCLSVSTCRWFTRHSLSTRCAVDFTRARLPQIPVIIALYLSATSRTESPTGDWARGDERWSALLGPTDHLSRTAPSPLLQQPLSEEQSREPI